MLLFLPVEIVERIVRFAVPQAYSSATYLERQDTLRSLCLVCRDLFPLAQRVLEETVRVSKPGTAKKVEQLLEDDAERARMLVLALQGYEIEAVKRGCAGLRDVQLSWVQDLQLGWLEQSRNLFSPVISGCDIAVPYPHLPAHRSMTWSNSRGGKAAIFSPFFTDLAPSLKTLAVWDTAVDGDDSRGVATAEHTPAVLVDTAITTLIFRPSRLSSVRHARCFLDGEGTSLAVAAELFSSLSPLLSRAAHPTILLTYLLLPTHCRPSNLPHGDLRTSVETFLFACTSRNIAVDFEDTDESPGGSLTSPRFEAYMAEKRAREGGDNKHGG